jgi:hypothetical protein
MGLGAATQTPVVKAMTALTIRKLQPEIIGNALPRIGAK